MRKKGTRNTQGPHRSPVETLCFKQTRRVPPALLAFGVLFSALCSLAFARVFRDVILAKILLQSVARGPLDSHSASHSPANGRNHIHCRRCHQRCDDDQIGQFKLRPMTANRKCHIQNGISDDKLSGRFSAKPPPTRGAKHQRRRRQHHAHRTPSHCILR